MKLTDWSLNQLVQKINPMIVQMNALCDLYERGDFGVRTVSEVDAEVLALFEEMLPLHAEIARRNPHDHEVQQAHRDFKKYGRRLRGTFRGYCLD